MNFKGNIGKIITTEEEFVVIKQKSFAFGSYEKKIPYSRIKSIEIDEPNMGTAGYIRIVEFGDERIFNKKKGEAALDDNSVLFNGKKNYNLAKDFKEFVESKLSNSDETSDSEKSVYTKKKKGGKLKFVIFAVIAFIIVQCNISNANKKNEAIKESQIPAYERFGISENDYAEISPIFEKCGFTKITKVEKEDELNDGTISYYIEMEGVKPNKVISVGKTEGNIITVYLTKDNKLSEILVNFSPVYKNGKILNKIEAFTELSLEEKTACQMICESSIKKMLKSPATAKFCDYLDYRWSKENGIIKAQGYVDSQNGFGAMVRTNYILTYDCVKQKAVSINVDGTKYNYE